MNRFSLAGGSSIAGAGLLTTCMCTFSSVGFGMMAAGGLAVIPVNFQAGLVLAAAGLVLFGMARRSQKGAFRAFVGFVIMGAGYFLAPPAIMNSGALPYSASQLFGFGLYPVGAGLIVAGFLTTFRTARPVAAGTAMGGVALASGCACCMVNGALNGMGAAAGLSLSGGSVFLAGMGVAGAGLARMGGLRPVILAAVGGTLAWNASAVADLFLSGAARAPVSVSFRFAGWTMVMGGIALAYHYARLRRGEHSTEHGDGESPALAAQARPAVVRTDS